MITKIKSVLKDAKLWQVLTTALLGYFGYIEVQDRMPSHDVNIEVDIPEHVEHTHKDWLPIIESELDKARKEHNNIHH